MSETTNDLATETDASRWGRVDESGTVFLRTADGERAVGEWHAGDPEEGLAFYARRYDELATRVRLLKERLDAGTARPQQAARNAAEIRESLPTAQVVGDLGALIQSLDEIDALVAKRRAESMHARSAASDHRKALVAEAETLATSSSWTAAGERLRAIVEEWKAGGSGDRNVDDELWKRLSAARRSFTERRKAAFEERERAREAARERKEQLIREAEQLKDSSEWAETGRRYRELMTSWKAAGRAPQAVEESLWQRFRAAQDVFFNRRSEAFATRDAEFAGNLTKKEALLAKAEQIDTSGDPTAAQAALRAVQDEWDEIGRVPREAMDQIEDRLRAVEDRVREAVDRQWRRTNAASNPIVDQLRRTVAELEQRVTSAKGRGDTKSAAKLEAELAGKRELLAHAEASLQSS